MTHDDVASSELVRLQRTLYASRNPTRRWLHCTRRDWILAQLERLPRRPQGQALEVGPGSGVYLPHMAKLFARVVATDIQTQYLDHLKPLEGQHPNLQLLQDDITASRLPAARFDVVLCTEVVEHIADSQAALKEMRRLLRPDGALILSTPQPYSPLELACKIAFLPGIIDLVRRVYREPVLETGHINLMSAREVERQLREAGFRIDARHWSGVYLPLLAEFGGEMALRIERRIEAALRDTPLRGLLWTQYFIARPDA